MNAAEFFSHRLRVRLSEIGNVPVRCAKGAINGKKQRKRSQSRAHRFASALARKDTNVWKSSRGKFATVEEIRPAKGGAK